MPILPILLALCLLVPATVPAAAQFAGPTLAQPSGPSPKKAPAADKAVKACPEYGAGYVRIAGSGACMKIGGYLRLQATAR